MKKFITSDWHLGDNRFQRLRRHGFSTEIDMVDHFVEIHNSVVSPDDLVIHVGDVQFDKAENNWLEHVSRFNGNKILIRGNHDRIYSDDDFRPYFVEIVEEGDGMEINLDGIECWATHHPSCSRINKFNLVGHIHDLWKVQLNMLNVGVDVNHYSVDMATIPLLHEYICNHFDSDVYSAYHPCNSRYCGIRGTRKAYFKHSDEY